MEIKKLKRQLTKQKQLSLKNNYEINKSNALSCSISGTFPKKHPAHILIKPMEDSKNELLILQGFGLNHRERSIPFKKEFKNFKEGDDSNIDHHDGGSLYLNTEPKILSDLFSVKYK